MYHKKNLAKDVLVPEGDCLFPGIIQMAGCHYPNNGQTSTRVCVLDDPVLDDAVLVGIAPHVAVLDDVVLDLARTTERPQVLFVIERCVLFAKFELLLQPGSKEFPNHFRIATQRQWGGGEFTAFLIRCVGPEDCLYISHVHFNEVQMTEP